MMIYLHDNNINDHNDAYKINCCFLGLCSQLLLSFSVLRNGRKVLNCTKNNADISCLHGIRVLSITWVVLGHCFTQLNGAIQGTIAIYHINHLHFYPLRRLTRLQRVGVA